MWEKLGNLVPQPHIYYLNRCFTELVPRCIKYFQCSINVPEKILVKESKHKLVITV